MFDLKSLAIGIILMLKKFTCFDVAIYAESTEEDYKNGIVFLPLLGFAVGFAACLISALGIFYDGFFLSAVILMYFTIITRTVNMRDVYRTINYVIKPKNGSEQISGIIGIIIIYLLYFSLIRLVPATALAIMPVAGFSGLIILGTIFDRDKDGTTIIKYIEFKHKIAAFSISFILAALYNYKLVVPLAVTYMAAGFAAAVVDEKIKILPNSIEGFIIEAVQLTFLTVTYLFKI